MSVIKKSGKKIEDAAKLTDDQLDDISGGYVFQYDDTPDWLEGYNYAIYKYEVIDDTTGRTLATFYDEDLAVDYARDMGMKTDFLSADEVMELRRKK